MPRHPVLVLSTEAIMAQALSLGDMLKSKARRKATAHSISAYSMTSITLSMKLIVQWISALLSLHTLHDVNPDAYYRARVIRDATNKLRYAEKTMG
jgi:enoyl-[acyl-carrier-protein] reductase (NADH)